MSCFIDIVDNRELRSLLFFASKTVVETIRTNNILSSAHRNNVDTLTWGESDIPVIFWNTCDDILLADAPSLRDIRILYPYLFVATIYSLLGDAVLYEDAWMRLARMVHYQSLVVDQVLYCESRRQKLVRRTEMIELSTRQW